MIKVILDTNILVSALWSPAGNASNIINLILSYDLIPCFNQDIIYEYKEVLARPKLSFPAGQVNQLLHEITDRGVLVNVPSSTIVLPDETDRKFYDIALNCKAYLITGNLKHFPENPLIISPAEFIKMYNK